MKIFKDHSLFEILVIVKNVVYEIDVDQMEDKDLILNRTFLNIDCI
jgi:hypothetical protein